MLKSKHAVLAAAVIAACSSASVFGQTTLSGRIPGPLAVQGSPNDNPDDRASAVIRIIDAQAPASQAARVNTAELVRDRAAGDMQTSKRGEPIQIERIQIDDPVRPGAKAGVVPVAQTQAGSDVKPQIVRAGSETRGRSGAIVRLDDAARYRETAKYEADRKRRQSEKAAVASEQATPRTEPQTTARISESQTTPRTSELQTATRISEPQAAPRAIEPEVTVMGSAQGRAEISWSAPERPAPPLYVVESPSAPEQPASPAVIVERPSAPPPPVAAVESAPPVVIVESPHEFLRN